MPPFFTIITSTYNAATTLPRLLNSLASQTCRDFNWIVQDGASSDTTMQIVEQYRDCLPEILADSSQDSGIYDAWNKAIDRWQDKMGEWVLFLGADDMLASKYVLSRVQNIINTLPKSIIFAAGDIVFLNTVKDFESSFKAPQSEIAFKRRIYTMPFPHNGLFTRKSAIQNKFNTAFHIAGDYDFILREFHSPSQLKRLGLLITYMGDGGISNTPENYKIIGKEMAFTIKTYAPNYIMLFKLNYIKYIILMMIKKYLLHSNIGLRVFLFLKKIKNKISK